MKELVSIIIPTLNEAAVIERLLKSLKKQTYSPIEMIIVDNNSTDQTVKIAKKFTKAVFNQGPERSAQRNFGAKQAKGQFLLFLDADMELQPELITQAVEQLADPKIGGVVIPEQSVARTFWEEVKAYERSFYNQSGDESTDAARFFQASLFKKVGGYDETITGPEDWDLPETIKKLGYQMGRTTAIIYHHERVDNPWRLAIKKFYYGLKSHRYLKKQQISAISPKTIYFLRPVFYRQWRKLISHPVMSLAMGWMLGLELVGGGLGYLVGRWRQL